MPSTLAEAPVLGKDCHLYYNSGTHAAATWVEIKKAINVGYKIGKGDLTDGWVAIRGTEGCMSFAPAFEGTRQTLFVCSNDPRFGGAPRKTIQFELENTPGYSGVMGRLWLARGHPSTVSLYHVSRGDRFVPFSQCSATNHFMTGRRQQPLEHIGGLDCVLFRYMDIDITTPHKHQHAFKRTRIIARCAIGTDQCAG